MTPDPVCVEPSATIRELARVLEEHEISGVPVVDREGRVIGVVSRTDLIRRCAEGTADIPPAYLFEVLAEREGDEGGGAAGLDPLVCVQDFMTGSPITAPPETPVSELARMMFENRIHRVIVVDGEGFPIGIVTSLRLLGVFAGAGRGDRDGVSRGREVP